MNVKETWKPVTFSGITGILMGAGAVYGAQKLTAEEEQTISQSDEMKEMTADDSMSFKHAFEAARAELGPGGVFHWRGNIYNTYTADEWNAMSTAEKQQFAHQVKPEVSAAEVDTNLLAEAESAESQEDVSIVNETENVAVAAVDVETESQPQSDDDDVRVIGYGDIDLANGRSVTVEELEINGQRVAVIDVDQDGVGDIAMSDLNHNRQADEGEIIDLHTGDVISFNNQTSFDDVDIDLNIMPS